MTIRTRRIPAAGVALVFATALAGCGGGSSTATGASQPAPTTTRPTLPRQASASTLPSSPAAAAPGATRAQVPAVVQQQLAQVDQLLAQADQANNAADPRQGKSTEGTAP